MAGASHPFTIRFLPDDRTHASPGPVDLYLAAAAAGILVEQPCGGAGTCGRCRVRVVSGDLAAGDADREHLTPLEIAEGWRLGCQLTLAADAVLELPPLSRSAAGKSFGPDLLPVAADRAAIGYGLAVDIGTTSLAAGLVSLADGRLVASGACLNPQVTVGADVIARIKHACDYPDGTARLSRLVRDGLSALVRGLLADSGRAEREVAAACVVGNPTMLQAWAGVSPAGLGTAPYAAAWSQEQHWIGRDLGLPVAEEAPVYVFPMVRSHVGADAVAAAVACGFDLDGRRRLLVDLGTNCEVLAGSGDRVVATSAAAGPAFEGVAIRCGMRAGPGAADVVSLDAAGGVRLHTVGDRPPAGLCGSGLIDLLAELLRTGVLAPSGYMRKPSELPALARPFAPRLTEADGQAAFLVSPPGSAAGRPVLLTARDVRELQLARGSTLAAVTLACRRLGFDPADLEDVAIAGAFGNFLRKASVTRAGLLPRVDPERVRFVGNAAGVGARLGLLDGDARARASAFAGRAEYLELATEPDYQQTFLAGLAFPDPGLDRDQ